MEHDNNFQFCLIFERHRIHMTSTELLDEVKQITTKNIKVLRERILQLTDEQRKWRKDNSSWNIDEIFAHLNEYAAYYHKAFTRKIERTRFRTPRENFVSSPLGRSAWRSMKLGNLQNVKRKMKSPRSYNPLVNNALVKGNDAHDFEVGQQELLRIIENAAKINIRKAKIPISISKIVRLRFGDALLFVVYHNERHVQQALNLIDHPNFPKS
jgi:hypothetical protein